MRPTSLREASPMNSTLRAAARCAVSDGRRPARELGRQQQHELALWFQPAQEARASVCGGCGKPVPFVIRMADPPGWRRTACADGDSVDEMAPTIVSRRSGSKLDTRAPLGFMSEWALE
jgi:hypothetical protein